MISYTINSVDLPLLFSVKHNREDEFILAVIVDPVKELGSSLNMTMRKKVCAIWILVISV